MTFFEKIKRFIRFFIVGIGRHLFSPFAAVGRRPSSHIDVPVHILISSKTWHCAILCLWSFERVTGMRWRLFIHDDGTVPSKGMEAVLRRFPDAQWVSKSDANKLADIKLYCYPVCCRLRKEHNYLMKVTDTLLFHEGGPVVILDADIIFYRRPVEICDWAIRADDRFLYMADIKEAYCMPRADLEKCIGINPAPLLNAGICCMPEGVIDLEFCESALALMEPRTVHPMFFDQTLLALAAEKSVANPLPPAYEISWNFFRRREAICRHYVGPAKFDLLYMEGPLSLLLSNFLELFEHCLKRFWQPTRYKR